MGQPIPLISRAAPTIPAPAAPTARACSSGSPSGSRTRGRTRCTTWCSTSSCSRRSSPRRAARAALRSKHLAAMRDGIGRVDDLLRAFGEFAAPGHLPPDSRRRCRRAMQLFAYDVRRATVKVSQRGPSALVVASSTAALGDLVAHAYLACIELARDGGTRRHPARPRGGAVALDLRADGRQRRPRARAAASRRAAGNGSPRRRASSPSTLPPQGGARLSLSFLHPR